MKFIRYFQAGIVIAIMLIITEIISLIHDNIFELITGRHIRRGRKSGHLIVESKE